MMQIVYRIEAKSNYNLPFREPRLDKLTLCKRNQLRDVLCSFLLELEINPQKK